MYCIDSNIAIDVFRGDKILAKKLDEAMNSNRPVCLTHITVCELFKGAFLHFNFEKKLEEVNEFVSSFDAINLSLESSREFGRLYKKLKEAGRLIPEFDIMIAAIVKSKNLILVTRDKKHFEDTGIKVEEW